MSQNQGYAAGKAFTTANSSRIVGGGFDVQGGAVLSGNVLGGSNIMFQAANKNRVHTSQGARGARGQQTAENMRGTMIVGSNKFGGNETAGGPTTFADSEDMNVQSRYNQTSGGSGVVGTLAKHQSAAGTRPGGGVVGQHEMKNLLSSSSGHPPQQDL